MAGQEALTLSPLMKVYELTARWPPYSGQRISLVQKAKPELFADRFISDDQRLVCVSIDKTFARNGPNAAETIAF